VIYTDTHAWGRVEQPLYDPILDLTGKPDYLVEKRGVAIPVEVKSGRTPEAPYDTHIFQLAVYCLLVERAFGKRPPYGIIHYPRRTFTVDYTQALRSALLDLLMEMRVKEQKQEVDRSHGEPTRCRGCGFRTLCDQSL
jgi:CRISPR-associated exonuclease Cas4